MSAMQLGQTGSPAPDPELRGRVLYAIDRAREIASDPNCPAFSTIVDAVGNYNNSAKIDPGIAHHSLRLALRMADPETRRKILRNLERFGTDEQHPARGGDLVMLRYDFETDPLQHRYILTSALQSPHPDVCHKGVWILRNVVEEEVKAGRKERALEEFKIYAPDLFELMVRFNMRHEYPAVMASLSLLSAVFPLDRACYLESCLLFAERSIREARGDMSKLGVELHVAHAALLGDGKYDAASGVVDFAMQRRYLHAVPYLLNRFGEEGTRTALNRVLGERSERSDATVMALLLNMGVHTLKHVTDWCAESPKERIALAVEIGVGFAATLMLDPIPPELSSPVVLKLRDWVRRDRVFDPLIAMAEDSEVWDIISRGKALRGIADRTE